MTKDQIGKALKQTFGSVTRMAGLWQWRGVLSKEWFGEHSATANPAVAAHFLEQYAQTGLPAIPDPTSRHNLHVMLTTDRHVRSFWNATVTFRVPED